MEKSSFQDFELSDEISKSILKLGYKIPSKVQQEVIPLILSGKAKNIIVKSQTGSGKTASFGIPICEKIEIEVNKPQVLILTPTRELCVQISEEISNIGRFKRIKCTPVFGKQPFKKQADELKQRTHIVAGTPGRTLDHIERGTLETQCIKYLIIDEADEMLNMGFIEQVEAILNKIPVKRNTMLFSATLPEEIESLCNNYIGDAVKVEISPENITAQDIEHVYYEIPEDKKYDLLNKVLTIENPDSCIIFCRTKENVNKLVQKLKDKSYPCNAIHGGMLQQDRLDVMNKFKRGEFIFLIATDIAARGIDVENVTHIINYDIPLEKESYVHRIGRTGRAGKHGRAITFITPFEDKFLMEVENYIGFKIEKLDFPSIEKVKELKEAFIEKINSKPILKKDKSAEIKKEITKIYLNVGKKKKVRAGDIVGAVTSIQNINVEDIGIIDIHDNHSYVDILNDKGKIVLKALETITIKGKSIRAEKAVK
ncbi:MAG: DEAD/DEAH box helicase [Bacillota bacterium]|nr:DEAD/DEAH box helicase [Bacillota bacterium]